LHQFTWMKRGNSGAPTAKNRWFKDSDENKSNGRGSVHYEKYGPKTDFGIIPHKGKIPGKSDT